MKRMNNRNHWHLVRLRIFRRDGYTCRYCQFHADSEKEKKALTVDHVVPLSKGGTNKPRNLVTACAECNQRKGARVYRHMLKKITGLVAS